MNKRETGLGVFFAIVSFITLLAQSSLHALVWAYCSYCAIRGNLQAIRFCVRAMLAYAVLIVITAIIAGGGEIARAIGYSREELIATGVLLTLMLVGLSSFLAGKLKLSLATFLWSPWRKITPPPGLRVDRSKTERLSSPRPDTTEHASGDIPLATTERTPAEDARVDAAHTKNDGWVFSKAMDEFYSAERKKELYARLVAECDGKEDMVRARYIAARARELTKESQASGASKIAALSNDAHALSAGQPVKADRIEEVELREDMACLREYRFRVLESGVMRLYQLDSGRFAVKRGTDFYIYRNLESAGAAYADKIGLRQGYLRDAIGSFNANQLLRDLFNRGEL